MRKKNRLKTKSQAAEAVDSGLAYYSFKPDEKVKSFSEEVQSRSWRQNLKRALLGLVALLLVLIIFWGTWMSIEISKNSQKLFGSGNLFSLFSTSPLKGEERGRVNLLLAGYSVDDPNHGGADLTDSIMLISLSTKNHSGYILSIPRDLYVKIPGFGHAKINEAYKDGGMGLLEKVVGENFGAPIDYYALINYTAFRDAVNAVGGISLNIQSPDPRGLYDPNISPADGGPLKLTNGQQVLNGQTALNLARARGDAYGSYGFPQSDFNRTQHQRQMLEALKTKAENPRFALNPQKVGRLLGGLGDNVKTDLQLKNVRRLYQIIHSTRNSQLQSVSLNSTDGKNLLAGYYTPYGQSALIPAAGLDDFSQIDSFITQLNSQ